MGTPPLRSPPPSRGAHGALFAVSSSPFPAAPAAPGGHRRLPVGRDPHPGALPLLRDSADAGGSLCSAGLQLCPLWRQRAWEGILRGPHEHSPAFCPPPTPLLSPVLKTCGVWPRSLAEGCLYQQGKKGVSSPWGGPEKATFCRLCHGEANVPLVQPPPSAAKHHPGTFLRAICTNPWKGRRGREGERKGGRERRRKVGREREWKGRKWRRFVRLQNPCW